MSNDRPNMLGRVRRSLIHPVHGKILLGDWGKNEILYGWADAAAQSLALGQANYKISAMFIEFKNVASPGDAVTVPSVTRSAGLSYYNSLLLTSDQDYLRVPMTAVTVESSDIDRFPLGNIMRFFAQSQGTTGVGGKTFSAGANSKIYGAALVVTPSFADAAQDIVFSRFYFPTDEQSVKLASSQSGIDWEVTLG